MIDGLQVTEPLTLNTLGKLVKSPREGNATCYSEVYKSV